MVIKKIVLILFCLVFVHGYASTLKRPGSNPTYVRAKLSDTVSSDTATDVSGVSLVESEFDDKSVASIGSNSSSVTYADLDVDRANDFDHVI